MKPKRIFLPCEHCDTIIEVDKPVTAEDVHHIIIREGYTIIKPIKNIVPKLQSIDGAYCNITCLTNRLSELNS